MWSWSAFVTSSEMSAVRVIYDTTRGSSWEVGLPSLVDCSYSFLRRNRDLGLGRGHECLRGNVTLAPPHKSNLEIPLPMIEASLWLPMATWSCSLVLYVWSCPWRLQCIIIISHCLILFLLLFLSKTKGSYIIIVLSIFWAHKTRVLFSSWTTPKSSLVYILFSKQWIFVHYYLPPYASCSLLLLLLRRM